MTFLLVTLGWVFFRAETFGHAAQWFAGLAGLGAGGGAWTTDVAALSRSSRSASRRAAGPNSLELPLGQPPALRRPGWPPPPRSRWC